MGDSVGVSVSFGKYENDAALCWEKWSTFSPNNKYLEEVGKCSTPGSVAQKKAFFEAHYKKIAAIKAAAEAHDLPTHDSTSDDAQPQDLDCTQTNEEPAIHRSGELDDKTILQSPITDVHKQLQQQEVAAAAAAVLVNDVQVSSPVVTVNSKLEEAVLVNDESMKLVKQHFHVDLESPEIRPKQKPQNVPPKINPNKVEKNPIGMKKKPAPKSPETTPASRLSKPKPTSSASSLKKPSAPSSSSIKNKNPSVSESRRVSVTPVALHLSMSMNSVNSDTASSVTSSRRRSLFMEQMGDKDIVKRAFKTFQNRLNQLPSSHTPTKQVPAKRSDQKTSTSMAYQKENERSRKAAAEKINPARGQLGPTWKSVSSGSLKGVGVDERRPKAGPTSVALKSNERRKEFLKNLQEKSNARDAERSQLSLKSKEVKDAEMKNLNSKAKRVPSLQGVSKSTSDKESIKSGRTR